MQATALQILLGSEFSSGGLLREKAWMVGCLLEEYEAFLEKACHCHNGLISMLLGKCRAAENNPRTTEGRISA